MEKGPGRVIMATEANVMALQSTESGVLVMTSEDNEES